MEMKIAVLAFRDLKKFSELFIVILGRGAWKQDLADLASGDLWFILLTYFAKPVKTTLFFVEQFKIIYSANKSTLQKNKKYNMVRVFVVICFYLILFLKELYNVYIIRTSINKNREYRQWLTRYTAICIADRTTNFSETYFDRYSALF